MGSGTGTTVKKVDGESDQTTVVKQTTTTRALEVLHRGNSTWKEIPISEKTSWARGMESVFDLQETIAKADCVFSGTVLTRKEYEVTWKDKNGREWGPYESTIIEVQINHTYYERDSVKNARGSNVIKIYYPFSSSMIFEDSVLIKDQGEYIFITQALDDEYVKRRQKEAPDDGSEPEKYADVFLTGPYYPVMPVENGKVIAYKGFFSWNEAIMKKANDSFETDKLLPKTIEKKMYIALERKTFDTSFTQLFNNPQLLS